jgi:hypothetical protein
VFLTVDTNVPVRLSTAAVDLESPEQTITPVLTYDFFDFEQRPPPEDAFRMKVRAVLGHSSLSPKPDMISGVHGHRGLHLVGIARERHITRAFRT